MVRTYLATAALHFTYLEAASEPQPPFYVSRCAPAEARKWGRTPKRAGTPTNLRKRRHAHTLGWTKMRMGRCARRYTVIK